ncbi:2-hydroxychromene-2-carboxylate isomerase [Kitasatospora sp. A2-31]|uniref:2-hydroxychromene-2-carboxylate isomerase n=1 Tax=Kitasatospora sp. A2-31 TaxID=2916414 RepID=UPI001EECDB5D|nr:DsbA family protein [Kitasatospora sp. A2-31]MCG6495235.1 DsbA family protein [Kitasatospora sp. A2-31]
MATRPRWYFSLRSPYSWMAFRDLVTRYADVADRIDWFPYWEPGLQIQRQLNESGMELAYVPMTREKHMYILQDTRRLCQERGLEMTWPVDRDPDWDISHLAYLRAEDLGLGREYIDLVSQARWARGEDISDPEVVAGVARRLGLDEHVLALAHQDEGLRQRGVAALTKVYQDGVFGVPFFIDGFEKFWGIDRLPGFVAAVRAKQD